jgi:hypothetical protein
MNLDLLLLHHHGPVKKERKSQVRLQVQFQIRLNILCLPFEWGKKENNGGK